MLKSEGSKASSNATAKAGEKLVQATTHAGKELVNQIVPDNEMILP